MFDPPHLALRAPVSRGTQGNLSVRLEGLRLLTGTARVCKARWTRRPVITDLEDTSSSGDGALPRTAMIFSSTSPPRHRAICHAHPPIATGFRPPVCLDKTMLRNCRLARYVLWLSTPHQARPGLANPSLDCASPRRHPHGNQVWSGWPRSSPLPLPNGTVEQFAKTTLVTELLGHQTLLPTATSNTSRSRARYGVRFRRAATKRDPLHARLLNPLSRLQNPSGASCPSVRPPTLTHPLARLKIYVDLRNHSPMPRAH